MSAREDIRVLSIQSHVVSGYVGNRAATFPLQLLGFDVDVVNTVQFSNHTGGYGHTNGHKTAPDQLTAIFDGLWTNGLVGHDRVLTGYIPGAEALQVVEEQIKRMKAENPDLIYVLDPVMGDIGKGLYVSEDVVPIYKRMLALATIITPNQFEVELLAGKAITSLADLRTSLHHLHTTHGLPHIAFSSIPLAKSLVTPLNLPSPPSSYMTLLPQPLPPWYEALGSGEPEDDILVCFASSMIDGQLDTWAFALPTVQGYFSGVGDLFSAMVLAHYAPESVQSGAPPLAEAVSKALLTVQQILLRTHLFSLSRAGTSGSATPRPLHTTGVSTAWNSIPSDTELDSDPLNPRRKARRMRLRELRVVQEHHLILNGGGGWPGARLDWQGIT